jgi:hypothetical protein
MLKNDLSQLFMSAAQVARSAPQHDAGCRRGADLDLLDEPVGAEDGGQLGFQDLDGDLAVVLEVRRRYTVAMPPAPSSRSIV